MPTRSVSALIALLPLWILLAVLAWLLAAWYLPWRLPAASLGEALPVGALRALAAGTATAALLAFSGAMVLRPLRAQGMTAAETLALGFLLAQAALGIVTGWLGFVTLGPQVGLLLAVAVPAWLWSRNRMWLREQYVRTADSRASRPPSGGGKGGELDRLGSTARGAAWFFFLLVVLAALAPAVESDGLRYHLVAPAEWLREGRFVNLPYNANSNLPALSGLLVASLTGVLEIGRVTQLFQAFNLGALMILAAGLAREAMARMAPLRAPAEGDKAPRLLSALVPLLIAGIPVVAILGAWPFTDVGSAAFAIAALRVAGPGGWNSASRPPGRWVAVGLLLGGAVAVKLSALPLAFAIAVYALARMARQASPLSSVAGLVASGSAVLGPWLVKSILYHGNPVYPVAWGLFGGPEWSAFNQEVYEYLAGRRGMGTSLGAFLLLPWNLFRYWPAFEEHNPGPGVLAFLPVLAAGAFVLLARLRRGTPRHWAPSFPLALVAILGWGVVTWFFTYQSVRFLIPHLVLFTVLGGALAVRLTARRPTAMLLTGRALLVLGIAGACWAPAWRTIQHPVLQAALGLADEDDFITRRFNAYPAVRWLNENTEPGELVFYIGEFRAAHARTYRPVASDWFDTPLVLVELRRTGSAEALLADLSRRGFRHVLYNEAELSLFMDSYRARFTDAEWEEFTALRETLMRNIAHDSLAGVYVARIP